MHVSYQGKTGPSVRHSITALEKVGVKELDQIYYLLCDTIKEEGNVSSPRGKESKEILDASFFLENPRNRVITDPVRNIKPRYLAGEFLWYLSGEAEISRIIKYSKFWSNLQDDHGKVNSNYGQKIFYGYRAREILSDESQMLVAFRELQRDPDSRRCIINIHVGEVSNSKDVPCTLALQFFIRDRKLVLSVNMRSNDLILGFGNDVFQFTMIQELFLRILQTDPQFSDLELGHYHHHAGSLHVYETHYDKLETPAFEEKFSKIKAELDVISEMPPLPKFDNIQQIKNWLNLLINMETENWRNQNTAFLSGLNLTNGNVRSAVALHPDIWEKFLPRKIYADKFEEQVTPAQHAYALWLVAWTVSKDFKEEVEA